MWDYQIVDAGLDNKDQVQSQLQALGADGWEHYETTSFGPAHWLWFKRQKAAAK